MRGGDHLDPGPGGQLALGEDPADLVVEDLRGGAGDRVEAGLAGLDQEVLDREAGARGAVDDLHRRERVHVHAGDPLLHGGGEVEVRRAGQLGVDAALHADLGGAQLPGLLGAVGDLLEGEAEGVGVGAALGERAEAAADVADVGEVDVAVDDVGHLVAHGVAAQVVGQPADRVEVGALGRDQRVRLLVGDPRRVPLGRPQGRRERPAGGGGARRRRCARRPRRRRPSRRTRRRSRSGGRRCARRCRPRCAGRYGRCRRGRSRRRAPARAGRWGVRRAARGRRRPRGRPRGRRPAGRATARPGGRTRGGPSAAGAARTRRRR